MKKAFTLIELLVVIAIIAILAAILFPVFAQAKLAAKKTAGLSQSKQIGTGTHLYLGDNDDVLYPYRWGSSSGPIINEYYMKLKAAGDPRATTLENSGATTIKSIPFSQMLEPYLKNEQLWKSPGNSNAWVNFQDKGTWDNNFHSYGGQNSYGGSNYLLKSNVGVPASFVAESSNTLLLVDATYYNVLPAQPTSGPCKLNGFFPSGTYAGYWKQLGNSSLNFSNPGSYEPNDPSNASAWTAIDSRFGGQLNVIRVDSSAKSMTSKAVVNDLRAKGKDSMWNPSKTDCEL